MAILNKLDSASKAGGTSPVQRIGGHFNERFADFCDWGIVFSLCASIFVLPASIAFLDSFVALAISIYFLKKINRIIADWSLRTSKLYFPGKLLFIFKSFAPAADVLNRPLQFLALAVFISVVFSQYPGLSLFAFFGKFVKCVFLYFSFIEAFSDQKRIRLFLSFFMASAFVTALSGVVQHYIGIDFIKGHVIGMENFVSSHRINSSFFGANGFGAYLLPVIGLTAHFLYSAVGGRKSLVWAGVVAFFLVLLLSCLCWTYSRSSWIGYLVVLFVMVLFDRRRILYAGALLLIFIFIFLPSLDNVRHMNLINDNTRGVQEEENVQSVFEQGGSGRLDYWKQAVLVIRSSPIVGTGLNTYTRVIKRERDHGAWRYAHNCYLQMTAETGFLGLACFLSMLFVLFRHALNYCKKIEDVWLLTILQGIVSGLFGFLVQSFFDNTFYTVQLGMLMWFIFGLMVAVMRINTSSERA
jgi:O-antigen ligase